MDWKHLLAYITGTVDQALLLRNEYLVTENRILHNQITGSCAVDRWRTQDAGGHRPEVREESLGGSGHHRQT